LSPKERKIPKWKQSSKKIRKVLIIGNRGSGKSSIAETLSNNTNSLYIDIDTEITKALTNEHPPTP
jgi:shikimate kinase